MTVLPLQFFDFSIRVLAVVNNRLVLKIRIRLDNRVKGILNGRVAEIECVRTRVPCNLNILNTRC